MAKFLISSGFPQVVEWQTETSNLLKGATEHRRSAHPRGQRRTRSIPLIRTAIKTVDLTCYLGNFFLRGGVNDGKVTPI